jgi:urea transport system permease protein
MKKGWKNIALTIWSSVCLFSTAHAQVDSVAIYANMLISDSDSVKLAALKKLVDTKDPEAFPLLGAINEKRLFLYEGKLITTGEKVEEGKDIHYLFSLPENKAITDSAGQNIVKSPSELKEIEFGRADRLIISPLYPFLNLTHPEKEKRKLSYSQFQNQETIENVAMLKEALTFEKDPEVLRTGREAVYSIQLKTAKTAAEGKLYVDSLVTNWGTNTANFLNEFGETCSIPELKTYTLEAAKTLDFRHHVTEYIQTLFSGISLGSIMVLIALGLGIVYGLAGVINMAHGEFMMIGAYTTFCMQSLFYNILGIKSDIFFWLSLPLAFIVAGCFGFIIERLIVRHLYSRPLESLLATWGVSLVMVQLARTIFGDLTAVKTPSFLSGGWEAIPHLILPYNRLFIIILTAVTIAITYYMLYKSRMGLRIRAVTQNRNMSSCLGIETRKVDALTFFIGSGLSGMAGCAITLIGNVVPDMGQTYIVDSFLVVVSGGVGKLAGTIFSGLGIGILTKALELPFEAVFGKVFILVIIIIFLQFKPKGLFPDKGRIGDD